MDLWIWWALGAATLLAVLTWVWWERNRFRPVPAELEQEPVRGEVRRVGHCVTAGSTLEEQVAFHSRDCLPEPQPPELVPVCVRAITVTLAGDGESDIELPPGWTNDGRTTMRAIDVIQSYSLIGWIYSGLGTGED